MHTNFNKAIHIHPRSRKVISCHNRDSLQYAYILTFVELTELRALLGMNLGIQDAHNLAWKLFWYERKGATLALLDTYQQERRAIAEEVIKIDKEFVRLTDIKSSQNQAMDSNWKPAKVCRVMFSTRI